MYSSSNLHPSISQLMKEPSLINEEIISPMKNHFQISINKERPNYKGEESHGWRWSCLIPQNFLSNIHCFQIIILGDIKRILIMRPCLLQIPPRIEYFFFKNRQFHLAFGKLLLGSMLDACLTPYLCSANTNSDLDFACHSLIHMLTAQVSLFNACSLYL